MTDDVPIGRERWTDEPELLLELGTVPKDGRQRYPWAAIAEFVRNHPGQWVNVYNNIAHSAAGMLMRNDCKWISTDEYDIATNNTVRQPGVTNGRRCSLYLRYNPPKGN